MQKVIYALLALCLLQGAYSACGDGSFTTSPAPGDAGKAECTACLPFCTTCTTSLSCTVASDKIKGVDRSVSPNTFLCSTASYTGAVVGYNKEKDQCQFCMEGCSACAVDYNVCIQCRTGWDFDRPNYACLRATVGLAAVVLALSVLTLLIGVITCVCACKL